MEKILIVDDDINLCTILAEELKEVGYESNFLTGGENVSEYIKTNPADLVLLDLKMSGKDGFQVLREIENGKNSNPKVIVLTAYADVKSAIDAAKLGATDFISKPYDFDELLITIRKVLQREN
jgi:two-component system NtrC family response regulator